MGAPRRVPIVVMLALGLVVAAVVLWSIGWFFATAEARNAFAQWRAEVARAGATFACGEETTGGFPFRLRFDCANPVIEVALGREIYVATATSLTIVAQVYNTDHLIAELVGPITVARRDPEPVTVAGTESGALRASVELAGGVLQRLRVVIPAFAAAVPAGESTTARLTLAESALHVRTRARPGDHDVAVRGRAMTLATPELAGGEAVAVDEFELIAIVNQVPQTRLADLGTIIARWRDAGGVVDVQRLSFDAPTLGGKARGTLTIGLDGRLEGALDASFSKLDKFIEVLEARGVINASEAKLSFGAVSILGSGSGSSASVAVPTRIREGRVYLGPVPVVSLPPLL